MKSPNDILQGANRYRRKLMKSISGLSIVVIMYGVLGCASTVRFTPVDFCSQPVNSAMARIVMSRESSSYGGAIGLRIFDNGQPIGEVVIFQKPLGPNGIRRAEGLSSSRTTAGQQKKKKCKPHVFNHGKSFLSHQPSSSRTRASSRYHFQQWAQLKQPCGLGGHSLLNFVQQRL